MINYISVRYEQRREVKGQREHGGAESFIIIRKGNVAIPVGRYGVGDKGHGCTFGKRGLLSTPQASDLFQGQRSGEVGGFIFGNQGLKHKSLFSAV